MFRDHVLILSFFFFNDTATTEIYTLSLHDALPISGVRRNAGIGIEDRKEGRRSACRDPRPRRHGLERSEEHTSELQSQSNLVCRLLLEKKKKYLVFVISHSHAKTLRTTHLLHP